MIIQKSKATVMKGKKTFRIADLVSYVIEQLKRTDDIANEDFKNGMTAIFEHMLLQHKKTFSINGVISYVNQQLKRTDNPANDDFKHGICTVLEHVLLQNNSYEGYNYNYWLEQGLDQWRQAGEPDFPEKDQFLYGPTGEKFNRHYYTGDEPATKPDKDFSLLQVSDNS